MLGWQCQEQVLMGPGCLTSAGENLSAWVRRSCLNLRKEKAGAGKESVRAQGRTGHPTRHRGPVLPALLFPCGAHPGGRRILTYSSLFTTPWPLGSNIRKALRMASSGSVPAGGGSQVNYQIPRL